MSFNRVILQGRLGADPTLKNVNDSTSVCGLSVATNRVITDRNGGRTEVTDWHSVSVWGKQAIACADRLRKGAAVLIEGCLRYTDYTDSQGVTRKKTDIYATSVVFLDPAPAGGQNPASRPPQAAQNAAQGGGWGNYAQRPQNGGQNGQNAAPQSGWGNGWGAPSVDGPENIPW